MSKIFTQAPIPFQGQKRRWNREFKKALEKFADCTTFIDLFGGSGLLSHYTKTTRKDAVVVYNDFDNYSKRIAAIDNTNKLLEDIRNILLDYPRDIRVAEPQRSRIIERITQEEAAGYVDYITLSSSLMFSQKYMTNYHDFVKETFYNKVRMAEYYADGYLDGLTIVSCDYKDLFKQYKDKPGVCFLIDPPYLQTDCTTYTSYWKLCDYLDVLRTLEDTNFFYFTSSKSNLLELCDWLADHTDNADPFAEAERVDVHVNSHACKYTDIMFYKHL